MPPRGQEILAALRRKAHGGGGRHLTILGKQAELRNASSVIRTSSTVIPNIVRNLRTLCLLLAP